MKKITTPYLFIFLLILISISASAILAQPAKFTVEIWQNGKPVNAENGVMWLEEKEFQIKITLNNFEGVFLNASTTKDYFNLKDNEPIPKFQYIDVKAMDIDSSNESKAVILDDEYFNHLYYNPKAKDSRNTHPGFDANPVVNGSKVTATKTISQLNTHATGEVAAVDGYNKALYLFFVAAQKDSTGQMQDYGRMKIHIEWK